jgi:hypothetical protein
VASTAEGLLPDVDRYRPIVCTESDGDYHRRDLFEAIARGRDGCDEPQRAVGACNVRLSDALVATLAYRVASYWLPLVAGIISYLLHRRRSDQVDPAESPARDEWKAG